MAYPDCPAWGEEAVKHLIESETVPPGEEKQGFDDRMLFIDTLALSIALKSDGKLLFEELQKKWPNEVHSSLMEAALIASKKTPNNS